MVIDQRREREKVRCRLTWLMALRLLFALFLIGSTIVYQLARGLSFAAPPVLLLYLLSGTIVLLCALYGVLFGAAEKAQLPFVYSQILIDSFFVSLVVFVTGGYSSVFPFLYLVVIIYASVFVYKRGTLFVAAVCAAQFGLLLVLQAGGTIDPHSYGAGTGTSAFTLGQAYQKATILTAACFAVALLSGYLSDQERKSKMELTRMQAHLASVQNLAQIGEMASGLAHEIKNPLGSISGAVQLLNSEMKRGHGDSRDLMDIVLRETDRLNRLVTNFLSFAKPSAGEATRVNLPDTVSEVVGLFQKDTAIGQRIKVRLDMVPTAHVRFDPVQLRQVIWNLLLNGAESITEKGNICIAVHQPSKKRVRVDIADNGCGMDEKTLSCMFTPFFTTKTKGTGLGLSVVYRILETYGCRMDVHSEPAAGSRFTLFFKALEPAST